MEDQSVGEGQSIALPQHGGQTSELPVTCAAIENLVKTTKRRLRGKSTPGKIVPSGPSLRTLTVSAQAPDPQTAIEQKQEFTRLVAKLFASCLLREHGEEAAANRIWE